MALDMTTALTIRAKVDGQQQIDRLGQSLGTTEKQANGLTGAFGRLSSVGKTLGGTLASIGIGALASTFAKAGIEADRTEKRIANLTKPFGETAAVMEFAAKAASTYGLSQTQASNAVADLYARLRPTGTSLDQIKTAFLGVNNAAAAMGLTADQTDGVLLQLSQALGSGKLQGDEFRSVMEQLPSIGQAIAKTMGVNIADLKNLGSEGKITSDIVIQALGELAKQAPPPPDAYKEFQAALADLQTEIGTKLLPALTPFVQLAAQLLDVFSKLPEPVQTLVVGLGGIAAALVIITPVLTPIVAGFKVLAGLQIAATIAGWAGAIGPLVASLGTLGKVLIAVFSGPVGWIALLVAAGVAIYAFRDQIAAVLKAIASGWQMAGKAFYSLYVEPLIKFGNVLVKSLTGSFAQLGKALQAPFTGAVNAIKTIFRGLLQFIANGINNSTRSINNLIAGYNRLPTPDIPLIPQVSVPAFAAGGVVSGPTLAMVGEGGEREYIVPESKMAKAAANYLGGMRGRSVIPAFADGGVVGPMGGGGAANTTVQITTGPVLQQDGQRYVTVGDLERALQDFGSQVFRNSRSYGGRRYQGAY
jgi:tape measure domain-containing protein